MTSAGSTQPAGLGDANAPADTFVLGHLSRLTAGLSADGTDAASVYRRLFQSVVEHYRPLVAKIEIRYGAASYNDLHQSEKLNGTTLIEVGSIAVSETLTDAVCEESPVFRINALDSKKHYVTIAVPVRDVFQSDTQGALSVALVPRSQADINALVAELNALALAAAGCIDQQDTAPSVRNEDWARVLTRVAAMNDAREFAFTLVNSLADRFDCGKASLGRVHKRRIEMTAISGLPTFKANSPGVADLRQAMEECLDLGETISHARGEESSTPTMPIHRSWAEKSASAVASIPIQVGEETIGVVTLSRSVDKPFTETELEEIKALVDPFGPAMQLIHRSSRSILQHIREEGKQAVQPWVRPRSKARIGFLAALGVFLVWFMFGSLTYRPVCETVLTPSSLNHMVAPFESRIEEVYVRSGDRVKKDQLLVRLDSRDLQLEYKKTLAQLGATKVEVGNALAARDAPAAALANARVAVLKRTLASIKNQIEQCWLRAPNDGLVVKADLKTRIGQTLPQGELLVSFSPGDRWMIEIHVPDGAAPYVDSEQTGVFRAYSHPDVTFAFDIASVSGSAEVIDGQNVFVADANLQSQADWMKSGMEGVARIRAQKRPVWWVCTHGLLDYLHMKFML